VNLRSLEGEEGLECWKLLFVNIGLLANIDPYLCDVCCLEISL